MIINYIVAFLGGECPDVYNDPASLLKAWKAHRPKFLAWNKASDKETGRKSPSRDHRLRT